MVSVSGPVVSGSGSLAISSPFAIPIFTRLVSCSSDSGRFRANSRHSTCLKYKFAGTGTCRVSVFKPIIMPLKLASIDTFFAGNSRATNDATNKVREEILATILAPGAATDDFYDDAEFGDKWRIVCASWAEVLDWRVGDDLKQMAGRQHNYDFLHVRCDGTQQKIELKCGSGSGEIGLNHLPQFLSLSADFDMFAEGGEADTYAAFYYDRFLDIYLDACGDAEVFALKPDRATYLKLVRGNNYDSTPFFRWLYDNEDHNKKEKSAIVDQSISSYLLANAEYLDLAKLSAKFADSQGEKVFVFWDMDEHKFTSDGFNSEDLRLTGLVDVLRNSLIVEAVSGLKYKMLLRWRNHKGVMLPAWQISLL